MFSPLGAEVLRGNFTDFYSGPVYSGRYNCSENAYNLYECPLVPDGSCTDVGPSRAVGFRCVRGNYRKFIKLLAALYSNNCSFISWTTELFECYSSDGRDYRQFGGEFTYFPDSGGFRATGRVDVCFNRTFGSVCRRGWDEYDAMAFCRYRFGDGTMGRVMNASEFGISAIGIVLTDVKCTSGEQIVDCSYGEIGRQVGTTEGCSGQMDVAGVFCSRQCDDGYVRLVGGEGYYEGRVEVCQSSQWRTICDVGWDDLDATIACRSVEFYGGKLYSIIMCTYYINSILTIVGLLHTVEKVARVPTPLLASANLLFYLLSVFVKYCYHPPPPQTFFSKWHPVSYPINVQIPYEPLLPLQVVWL